jgi:hypothetical protein
MDSTPISAAEVRRRLLISAAEDYEPMFHALWEFGIPADPVPGAPSQNEVKEILWRLIEDGFVDLFQGQDAQGEFIPVPPKLRKNVFLDPLAWRVIEDPAVDVRYSTTAAGDAEVRNRTESSPDTRAPRHTE